MTEATNLPRIKVCGLTHPEDLRVAVLAGADALGFVLHPASPRAVDPVQLPALLAPWQATAIWRVGVLVDVTPEQADALQRAAGLDALQLCGTQQPADWAGFPLPLLRRIPVAASGAEEIEAWRGIARGFVLDHPSQPGGTGRTVDFAAAARLATQAPCLLAGGLSAGAVPEAIAAVAPHGVDAASRLEQSPGRKNPAAVYAYVRAARHAFGLPIPAAPPSDDA